MQDQRLTLASAAPLPFLMVLQSDHRTPAPGLSPVPVVTISQNGGAFAPPVGLISEIADGWYQLSGAGQQDLGAIGPLLLHAVDPSNTADPCDVRYEIVAAPGVAPVTVGTPFYPMTFLMINEVDHVTGLAALNPTVQICKVGGSFASPVGHVFEIGGFSNGLGWYRVGPNASDYDTPGPLLLRATSTGADFTDEKWDVVGLIQPADDRVTLSLIALKTMIINAAIGFTQANCIISLESEPFTNPSPPCCFIAPGDFSADMPDDAGGGRYLTVGSQVFVVRVVVRRASDIQSQDVNFLTNASRGGYPIVYQVVNALQEEFLLDIAGNPLTTVGLKLVSVGKPYRYGKEEMMGVVAITFRTNILLDLAVPGP